MELVGYVARQSIISAVAGGNDAGFDLTGVSSSFQRRMVLNDLNGSAVRDTIDVVKSGNFVVWDLTDERNGVFLLSDKRIITAVALNTNGLKHTISTRKKIHFASKEFRAAWKDAAVKYAEKLGGFRRHVIVNATPWATTNEDGTSTPLSYPSAIEFNRELAWMAGVLKNLGFPVIAADRDKIFGDPEHQWGPAPFHFAEITYLSMCKNIRSVIDASRRRVLGVRATLVGVVAVFCFARLTSWLVRLLI